MLHLWATICGGTGIEDADDETRHQRIADDGSSDRRESWAAHNRASYLSLFLGSAFFSVPFLGIGSFSILSIFNSLLVST